MKNYTLYKYFATLLLAGIAHFAVKAQIPSLSPTNGVVPAIFNTAGGSYDNQQSYYRFEWSFGESLIILPMSPADSSVLVTHGVLQPCTDKMGSSPQTVSFINGDYKLFPNPTKGAFELNFFIRESGMMSLQLINTIGQVLDNRSFHYEGCCRIELFDLSRYPAGTYFIIADLVPGMPRPDGIQVVRHSGFKVVKLMSK